MHMMEKESLDEMFELDIRVSSPSSGNDFADFTNTIGDISTAVDCTVFTIAIPMIPALTQ